MCCQKGSSKSATMGSSPCRGSSAAQATAHGLARCSGYSTCTPPRSSQRLRCPRLHPRGRSRRPLSAARIAVTRWRCASCFQPRLATHLEPAHALADSAFPVHKRRPGLLTLAMRSSFPPIRHRGRVSLILLPQARAALSSHSAAKLTSSDGTAAPEPTHPALQSKAPRPSEFA
jgi:hypothetical protein